MTPSATSAGERGPANEQTPVEDEVAEWVALVAYRMLQSAAFALERGPVPEPVRAALPNNQKVLVAVLGMAVGCLETIPEPATSMAIFEAFRAKGRVS